MRLSLAAFLVASAAIFGAPAFAQDALSDNTALRDIINNELSGETQALADELVQITGTARLFDALLPNIADEAKNSFIRSNPQMQLGIIAVVDTVAVEMVSRRPELDRFLARVWASGFTDDEMQDLIDFYSSPTGQKFAQTHGQILAVQTAAAEQWAQSVAAELDQRVREELAAAMAAEREALQSDGAG
ncbi:MAG: DUF2059 domain-containing protein, partial [Pseudomonadales bacterium]|nr:DUF2059 domain-containing protein [Pseudomonadales bacterium]